ncbi:MAG TPA: hypothetical protein VM759_03090 [Longimicrobium sp.]|nr:hypothetical protein [Longimicrobium sp.]
MARASELRAGPDGALRIVLARPAAEVLLPAGAAEPRLTQLRATLDDVARRTPRGGEATVDARFADQVVVRLPRAAAATVPHPVP